MVSEVRTCALLLIAEAMAMMIAIMIFFIVVKF